MTPEQLKAHKRLSESLPRREVKKLWDDVQSNGPWTDPKTVVIHGKIYRNVRSAAKVLKISTMTIYSWIHRGDPRAYYL